MQPVAQFGGQTVGASIASLYHETERGGTNQSPSDDTVDQ